MATRSEEDDALRLRSTVEHGTMTTQIPADFGMPGAYRLQDHPGSRDSEDHGRIYKGMVRKQLKPLADVKVLKGTVYSYKNRRIITRWIRDVCAAFKHKTTTFNMAVQFTDLFLYHHRDKLPVNQCQLVALACIWISAKFEETDHFVPSLQALVDVCDRAYTKDDIIDMEETLLGYVSYKVPHTTAINFMHLYLHCVPTVAAKPEGIKALTVFPELPVSRAVEKAADRSGQVDVLIVDRNSHQSGVRAINGVTEGTKLASLVPHVASVLRIPPTTETSLYLVLNTPVRLAKPVGNMSYSEAVALTSAASLGRSSTPTLYARLVSAPNCVFAERAGWMLMRTPNDELLRVAEAALREALVNVEFLKVEQRVLGLAAISFASAMLSPDYIATAATISTIQQEVGCEGIANWEHFRSAVQLIGEKYAEMVQSNTSVGGAGASAVAPLPLPPNMQQRVDAFLSVVAPRSGMTVVHPAPDVDRVAPKQSDFDNL